MSPAGLYAPDHQHFFCCRLDLAIDGVRNRVVEEETQGFLSLGTAEGGTQRSEREGGKLVLGESTHSRVHLRF